ncbi:oxygen-independent coproporphyrinogen III oxidase [Myxococcus stipitatus DSM 14675]|uniref:Oxygen-independent coproporphyrinogen III oxidase n=1 Tax=Myxococcus stipitatus (strain DSM 14675 / JCM 12634 / Mx s8) TaxID=1278073 RepID=L7U857_MYXSD|nr:radical SAM protein [Myxococcus stipitatus]AGC43767.1 oxygen-independent coproporphyrinogen III oxidase [Myxococcus stipitatus DSM 14675]
MHSEPRAQESQGVLHRELERRMSRPQRHRLLEGYPMAPLLKPRLGGIDPIQMFGFDHSRPLIVGVLPHTFCNPKVRGCGFCTFPHESFANEPMRRVVAQVAREIERTLDRVPELGKRTVDAVYLGGGTANLTPPSELKLVLERLEAAFDLNGAELSLEGVPKYFLLRQEALLDVLADTRIRHRRISMGIQTFDPDWLRRMGRDAFGDVDDVRRVIESAHRRGFTVSGDLLFNLPGMRSEHALADVERAIELGFDQVCMYNLVLTEDLDSEWAKEQDLVQAMPEGGPALETWLAVRERLLTRGFVQTTLTNFERADVARSPRRFIYEVASFDPATWDGIGFGPGALSTFKLDSQMSALKWRNAATSESFTQVVSSGRSAVAAAFRYKPLDLRLLHLTRNLARLEIDCAAYERFFGTNPFWDFPEHFELLMENRLITFEDRIARLTPVGMFYADAVAGLFAHRRVLELRETDEGALHGHMG